MSVYLLSIAIFLCVLFGAIGIVSPIFPGLPLLFASVWILAYMDSYQYIGTTSLVIYAIITVIGLLLDYVAGMMGAKYSGASKKALWGALIGGFVGIFFGLPGILLGPVIGAMVGEILEFSNAKNITRVGIGTFLGYIAGIILKVILALIIIGGATTQYLIGRFS